MYQYSFANVDLKISFDNMVTSFTVTGYGTGEGLINMQRRAPVATTQFGAYGDMVVSMQRILGGDLSFPILMNSPENAELQKWANDFQSLAHGGGQLVTPLQASLVDKMGGDECHMTNGVILAMPAMVRGQTMNVVTWVLSFERMVFHRNVGADHTGVGKSVNIDPTGSRAAFNR